MSVGASGARAAANPVVDGLTAPAGAVLAPDGSWWVSDHLDGFCRVLIGAAGAPGATVLSTCLGGGGVAPAPGPASPGTPALHDPTPAAPNSGDEIAYVPDSATGSRLVYRLAWNPGSRVFTMRDTIALVGAEPDRRPTVASLGPDGNLYVATGRTTDIQEIVDPEGAAPTARVVGAVARQAGIAAGVDAAGALVIYTAEPAGIGVLRPSAAAPPLSTLTNMNLGFANAAAGLPFEPGALAFDVAARALYVGTASAAEAGAGVDKVSRFAIGPAPGEQNLGAGFESITGLSLAAGGIAVFDGPVGDTADGMSILVDPRVTTFLGPLPPAPTPVAPVAGQGVLTTTTTAPASGRSAVARIARLRVARRISVRRLRRGGLRISVRAAPGTTAVRVRVHRRSGPAATRLRASYRRALPRSGRIVFTVPARKLRRVGRGRFTVRVTPLAADGRGPTLTSSLRVTR